MTPEATAGRQRLLDGAVEYFAAHGVTDTSLRHLAERIGTSHRMLLYHFGSREGLLAAVVDAVEQAQRDLLASLTATGTAGTAGTEPEPDADPLKRALRFWDAVADAATIYGPLFFELSGHAMQGQPHAAGLRPALVEAWLDPLAATWIALGQPPDAARRRARLDLAVARGLLYDLLITGDRAGVDAAMRAYVAQAAPRPGPIN